MGKWRVLAFTHLHPWFGGEGAFLFRFILSKIVGTLNLTTDFRWFMSNNIVLCLSKTVYLSLIVKRFVYSYKHLDQARHSCLKIPRKDRTKALFSIVWNNRSCPPRSPCSIWPSLTTDISHFIQLIRRTVYFRLQIYFNETKILNKLRRFTIGEAKRLTWIDGFTLKCPISTRLTRQLPEKSKIFKYWNSSTQQNNWKLTVFNGVFRPKYCRSARHSLETPFLAELKL